MPSTPNRDPQPSTPPPASRQPLAESIALIVVLFALVWFYKWTISPDAPISLTSERVDGYYTLLTRGFMKGHLYLDTPADPFLSTLKDPADPAQRAGHGMHDVSYFKGHYYLYFGVTPVVVAYLPFRLLTGRELNEVSVTFAFVCLGLAASGWILLRVRRRYFPATPSWLVVLEVVALGTCSLVPLMLRRTSFWEQPIACAYGCFLVALALLYEVLHARRPVPWLAGASLLLGLTVGARPTYVFACAILLIPLWLAARAKGGVGAALRDPSWRRLAVAALLPVGTVGLLLAVYNFERFGSPTDFGIRYQMTGVNQSALKLFDWSYPIYGMQLYWLAPAGWGAYFPFVSTIAGPASLPASLSIEDPFGLLPNVPMVVFALALVGLFFRRAKGDHLADFCAILAAGTLATMAVVMSFAAFANRYMVDFVPGVVLLATIGMMAVLGARWCRGWRGLVGFSAVTAVLTFSIAFSVLASLRHNELLRANYPRLYLKLAHAGNQVPAAIESLAHVAYGPVVLKVIFPTPPAGTLEPLVATGHAFLSDYVVVHYDQPGHLSFGIIHTSWSTTFGPSLAVAVGVPHEVQVQMGSLYPPIGHPYFDGIDRLGRVERTTQYLVTVDGQVALKGRMDFYDAAAWKPLIGHTEPGMAFAQPFSGQILSRHRIRDARQPTVESAAKRFGPVQLVLTFPPFTGVRSEPLMSSGETGRGDLIYVTYLNAHTVTFGLDHWGRGGPTSAPVTLDPNVPHQIELDHGALHEAGLAESGEDPERTGELRVNCDGRPVLSGHLAYWPCFPESLNAARNTIRTSTATEAFTGTVQSIYFIGKQ